MSKFFKAAFIGAALSLATVSVAGAQMAPAAAAPAVKFSADTAIETIAANPAAKAALDKVVGAVGMRRGRGTVVHFRARRPTASSCVRPPHVGRA